MIIGKTINKSQENLPIELALQKYQNFEITLWKAAELAGISLSKMMDEAQKRKIPHQYSVEDFLHDIDILQKI